MRDPFPYMGYKKFLMIVVIFLLLCGIKFISNEKYTICLPKEGVALAEEVGGISEASIIREIEVAKQENVSVITIKASKPLTYTVVKLKDPLRIVVDVPDFTTEGTIETLEVNSNVIKRINNKQMKKGERTFCRIEIGLNLDAEYKVVPESNDLVISVAGPSELVEVGEKVVEKGIAEEVPERKSIEVKKIIDLKISKDHNRMTVVSDSEMIDYNAFTIENPYRLVVDIPDAEKHFSKNIFTFKSPFLDKIKIGQHQKKVRFVVYFQDRLPTYRIEKDDNKLSVIWEMPAVAEKEKKVEEVIAEKGAVEEEKVKEVAAQEIPLKEEEKEDSVKKEEEISEEAQIVSAAREGKLEGEKVYTGRKISLDFKDADIRNIIRLIADISGLNIIVSEKVKGKVTIKLDNIPWDQVLDVILETNSLGKIWMDTVLRIETREEIKRISDEKYRAQKSQEKVADLKSEVVDIIYRDAKDVLDLLVAEKELTSERGAISVDPNLNRLIITDTEEKIENIKKKIVRYDDRTVRQVYIEAKIVQSIPTFTKEIGVQWGGLTYGTRGETNYAIGGAGGVDIEEEEDPATGDIMRTFSTLGNVIDLPAAAGAGTGGGVAFGILRRNFNLTATLTAMEKDEKLKIISSPRVLSVDKNEAMIKQGVALPYLKLSEEGVTSTEFKDAVLELIVTPTILSEKIIKIDVGVKKDQKSAQTGAGGEPGIDVREAKTVLMVESGRTVVIGGIYEETTNIIRNGVPFFSGIPGLGRLFRNDYNKKELTELLIFITTTIVPKEIIQSGG